MTSSCPPKSEQCKEDSLIKPWQTRILRLYPGVAGVPMKGDLLTADIIDGDSGVVLHDKQEFVQYEAILYTWGAPEFDMPIQINQMSSKITPTLWDVLTYLRRPKESRLL